MAKPTKPPTRPVAPVKSLASKPAAAPPAISPIALAMAQRQGPAAVRALIAARGTVPQAPVTTAQPPRRGPGRPTNAERLARAAMAPAIVPPVQAAPKAATVDRATAEAAFRAERDARQAAEKQAATAIAANASLEARIAKLAAKAATQRDMLSMCGDAPAVSPGVQIDDSEIQPWIGWICTLRLPTGARNRDGSALQYSGETIQALCAWPSPQDPSRADGQHARNVGRLAFWPLGAFDENGQLLPGDHVSYLDPSDLADAHCEASDVHVSTLFEQA